MNQEHVKEVFSDEAFVKDLFASQSLEVAQKKLLEKDIDVSTEDIKKMIELVQKHPDGQLSEEELESVSGGTEVFLLVTFLVLGLGAGGLVVYDLYSL